MVRGSRLELDDALFEGGRRGEKRQQPPRGRADNALAVLLVLTVAMVILLGFTYKGENWWAVALIGLLFLASELFALPMKGAGRLSLALLPVVMAMMISGPVGAAVVSLFGVPIYYMDRGGQGFRKPLYNAAMLLFCSASAAWVFRNTGGETIDAALKNGGKLVLPWLLAVVVFCVFNTVLAAVVLAPEKDRPARFWRRRMLRKLPGYVLYGGIGFLAAIVYVKLEYPAVVLLIAPLLAIRVVYTRFSAMRDVCDETTLAVMEVVESQGMFMEGHSLGVADMAVAIAEEMDFAEEDVHYVRQAGLLHDVGKLAIDMAIVDKPGALTPEEYAEIKNHPLTAANTVSKEQSFATVTPTVRHHHEMTDGNGYPDGLAGETIPVGARILAVADAYDAMLRPVAYREPLSAHQAASEVVRAKGIQFDPEVVDAFVRVVTRAGTWSGALESAVRMPPGEAAETAPGEQPSLEFAESEPGEQPAAGATPAEGIKYSEVRSEIEKDIREWERTDIGGSRRRARAESRRGSRKRKGPEPEEGPPPQG